MPDYEIHDGDTGMKLAVTGDEPPSPEVADVLMQKEFNDIKTNLFQLPGNKWFLDVGPLYENREYLDKNKDAIGGVKRIEDAHNQAKKFANQEYDKAAKALENERKRLPVSEWKSLTQPDWKALYKAQVERYNTTNPPPVMPSIAEAALSKEPPGTIFIGAHGSRSNKNLSTEWGHEFTMHNLSKLLGDGVSGISNIVNTACYGASCEPNDYQSAFPAASSIRHINTNQSNVISMKGFRDGKFFSGPEVNWKLVNGEWVKDAPIVAEE